MLTGGGWRWPVHSVPPSEPSHLHTPPVCLPSAAGGNLDQHNCINKIGKDYSNLDKTYLVIYFITQTSLKISSLSVCAGSQLVLDLAILILIFFNLKLISITWAHADKDVAKAINA